MQLALNSNGGQGGAVGAADDMPSFTVEVPPANLIYAEILAVTSAMRKNQRWASSSSSFASASYSYRPPSSFAGVGGSGQSQQQGLFRNQDGGGGLRGHQSGREQRPSLMGNFAELKMRLREGDDNTPIDALALLHPFLEVVRSPETSGPITATALSSIDKFITYSVLTPSSPNLAAAMAQLSSAGTHCKFEASDSVSDEVVLLKILDVLRNSLTGRLGGTLSDESVCEMMETGLSMCCQMRLSEMLRRSAERTMQAMVASVFSRLRQLPDEVEAVVPASTPSAELSEEGAAAGLKVAAPDPRSAEVPAAKEAQEKQEEEVEEEKQGLLAVEKREEKVEEEEKVDGGALSPTDASPSIEPFGLASIAELLRVLISLLNPHDQQHTDTMRLMALGLLNIAFEVGGRSMARFTGLRTMVADHLCKHLFQLARSDNPALLSHSLRVITNIFSTLRPHLKLQQELFLSFLLDRLILPPSSSSLPIGKSKAEIESQLDRSTWAAEDERSPAGGERPATPGGGGRPATPGGLNSSTNGRDRERSGNETRELMLEILGHYARGSYTLVDLWVNYDCAIEGEDLFERLIRFLSRGVYPSHLPLQSGNGLSPYGHIQQLPQDSSQLMCLDTLLELVQHMAGRLSESGSASRPSSPSSSSAINASAVLSSKSSKRRLLEGAAAFNLKPKVGLKYLEEHGLIYAEQPPIPRPESLARFFRNAPKLDKKVLGEFISRPEQLDVLKAFMQGLDFKGKIICDALRDLLEGFRLPGESQQIARITETFAEVYFATGPPEIKSQDAVYVLSYSIIMLNTDQHNPQVNKRMDLNAYSRNLKGVNDNSDFAMEYLQAIFESIRKREIILPEEHQNQVGFEHGWKELLRRARRSGSYTQNPTGAFDEAMFSVVWKPVVSALSYAFANFQDDHMVQRAIGGFNHCASLAARFNMPEVFDYLLFSLSRVSGLIQPSNASQDVDNFPVVEVEGQKITLSPLAVHFGENVKAQLAAVVLFTIANSNGAFIRQGWMQVFEIYQTLFIHSLLPPSMLMMEDFLSGESAIPLKPKTAPTPREERRGDGGLLSTLSSYLLSPYGAGGEIAATNFNDDDVEQTLSTIDTIASCRIDELYSHIFDLEGEALLAPLQVLTDLVQRLTIERVRTKSGSGSSSTPNSPQISLVAGSRVQLPYDPSAVLLLEVATSIVARSKESLAELWPSTFDFLSKLLASSNSFSSLFNERVVASLLRLVVEVIQVDELRDSTFLALDMLRSLSPTVLSSVAEPLMAGLSRVFTKNADRIHSATEWNLLFALFSSTAQQEAAAKISVDLLRQLAAGQLGATLHHENYAAFLQTLAGFAHVAQDRKTLPDRSIDEVAMVRGQQIVDVLREVQTSIPGLISTSTLPPSRAWEAGWIPLLTAYAQLCLNPSRELRQNAISSLQRTLLAPEILQNADVDLTIIFERVFFPLLEELLKPQVFRRDPDGMGETRLRASALLCKIFLQYLTQLSERQGMHTMTELWLKILGYQDRFMHSGRRDQMFEAVPELLKNVLLVMNASGFLLPPFVERNEEQARLFDLTFERLSPFLPELQRELFPPPRIPVPFSAETAPPPSHHHDQQYQQQQQQQQQQQHFHAPQPVLAPAIPQIEQHYAAPPPPPLTSSAPAQQQQQQEEEFSPPPPLHTTVGISGL